MFYLNTLPVFEDNNTKKKKSSKKKINGIFITAVLRVNVCVYGATEKIKEK